MAEQASTSLPNKDEMQPAKGGGILRVLGTGVITGAADDDPSAIGTYASERSPNLKLRPPARTR
jgi:hypothetical protein